MEYTFPEKSDLLELIDKIPIDILMDYIEFLTNDVMRIIRSSNTDYLFTIVVNNHIVGELWAIHDKDEKQYTVKQIDYPPYLFGTKLIKSFRFYELLKNILNLEYKNNIELLYQKIEKIMFTLI